MPELLIGEDFNQSDVTHSRNNLTTEFGDHSVFFPQHVLKRESLFQLPLFDKKKTTLFLISMYFFNIKRSTLYFLIRYSNSEM